MTSINVVAVVKQAVALPVVVNRGVKGDEGNDGWSPVFAVIADGDRRVQQVIDWAGGTGAKPATGKYVGVAGLVDAIGDAVDIRGAAGDPGDPGQPGSDGDDGDDGDDGWSPLFAVVADGDRRVQQVIDWASGTGAKPATGKYVGVVGLVDAIGDAVDIRGATGDPGDPGQPGSDGDDGDDGWSPVFAVIADGDRRVQQVIDWAGGTGAKPATGKYVGVAGLVDAIGDAVDIRGAAGDPGDPGQPGSDGDDGDDGDDGWSPLFAVVADGDRRVQRVVDWTGGTGVKPATGKYVGMAGLVDAIGAAVDIRGAAGDPGDPGQPGSDGDDGDDGWSPLFAIVADGDRRVQQVIDWASGTGAKPATGKYVGVAGLVDAIGDAVDIRGATGDPGDPGQPGSDGDDGDDGWSPVFAVIADGDRRVQQVIDWAGGTGAKPATGKYVGSAGFTSTIADAVDIRGPASAGGGSDPIADGIFFEDFLSAASTNIGPLGLATSQSGTGAAVSNSNNSNSIGTKVFETGTTNAGTAFVATGGAAFSLGKNGATTFKCRLKLSALSDATDNYQLLIGFSDFVSSLTPYNGIYFRYNSAISPNWLACSVRSAVETVVDTGIPVTTAYQNLAFTMNEGATSIAFTVDGVPAATITTNIQDGTRAIVARINKIAGTTNRSMEIDYLYLERRFNFSRG